MKFKYFYGFYQFTIALCCFLGKVVNAWPDGAPCIYSVTQNMNPLEAVEHQGGLQLTPPPFTIDIERQCYWRGQLIRLFLRGNTTRNYFKGFAIQPLIFNGPRKGQRIGEFQRLDESGSWQQQCFRNKDSVTHSHDEKKNSLEISWTNNENEEDYVQFVATVVVSLRVFWVKSVVSAPLPPCHKEGNISAWLREPITKPPPVSSFKMDTFFMFNREKSRNLIDSFVNVPNRSKQSFENKALNFPTVTAPPTFVTIKATTANPIFNRRLNHVIPIPDLELNRKPQRQSSFNIERQQLNTFNQAERRNIQPAEQFTSNIKQTPMQQQQKPNQQFRNNIAPFRETSRTMTQQQFLNNRFRLGCQDLNPTQCFSWIAFCSNNAYMQNFCQRTCRLC